MWNTIKSSLKTAGWITVGVTAIAGEKVHHAGKHVINHVRAGVPQDLVRSKCSALKSRIDTHYAVSDCPHDEPLHYHHDGCPACTQPPI